MIQYQLFQEYLDPIQLKEGKSKCPCCQRKMKAYGYNLDKIVVHWLIEVGKWCAPQKRYRFDPREVFADLRGSAYKNAVSGEPSKASFHGLVERTKNVGTWRLTRAGAQFLAGKISLPSKVWVFNNSVILTEDKLVHIDEIEPRWKIERSDWTMDYVLTPYRTTI